MLENDIVPIFVLKKLEYDIVPIFVLKKLENDIVPIFVLKKLEIYFSILDKPRAYTGRNYFSNIFYAPKIANLGFVDLVPMLTS